jgi:putative transposase
MIDVTHPLSVRQQCRLLGLDRSGLYYAPVGPDAREIALCHRLDELYTAYPFYGVRRMTEQLRREGQGINPKRVRRLLRQMGLWAVYPKPRLSWSGAGATVFPYLLRGVQIERPHQVWAIDITYVRLRGGFAYLVALLEWFSRYVLAWELAPSLETLHCVRVLEAGLAKAGCAAEITNSDQGRQFTSAEWIGAVQAAGMRVSHDGRGRALDNVMVERLWRTVKYEDIYLRDYGDLPEARTGLGGYFRFYNEERLHQGLDYRTPLEVLKGTPRTSREGTGNGLCAPSPFRFKMGWEQNGKTTSQKSLPLVGRMGST